MIVPRRILGAQKFLGGFLESIKKLINPMLAESKAEITPLRYASIAIQKLEPLRALVVCAVHQIAGLSSR